LYTLYHEQRNITIACTAAVFTLLCSSKIAREHGYVPHAGLSMLDEPRFPKWLGWGGVGFSLLFQIGAFRNVASAVQMIADINNGLLPLWMIVLGTALV